MARAENQHRRSDAHRRPCLRVELVNSHHSEYQSVKPTSQADCDKILVKRLEGRLR